MNAEKNRENENRLLSQNANGSRHLHQSYSMSLSKIHH